MMMLACLPGVRFACYQILHSSPWDESEYHHTHQVSRPRQIALDYAFQNRYVFDYLSLLHKTDLLLARFATVTLVSRGLPGVF